MSEAPDQNSRPDRVHPALLGAVEVGLIFLLFFLHAGWSPPAVNEAHYLAKAKHFWNPDWCPGDHFLESADAHAVFYRTVGWLTLFFSLSTVAWAGRIVTWLLLAWGWRRLSYAMVPRPLISVLTAGLFLCFSSRAHMAGEWVVGGVEAKCIAYGLVLLGVAELIRGHWNRTWLLLGAASSFHVLVGGWSVIAAGCAWLCAGTERPRWWRMIPALLAGGLLALPGLVAVLMLNHGTSAEVTRAAAEIYVFDRLDHHLLVQKIRWWYTARFLGMLGIWLALTWWLPATGERRRLSGFVLGAVYLGLVGIAIETLTLGRPALTALLMRFYWYRLVDVAVPLGLAITAADAIAHVAERGREEVSHWLLVAAILLAGVALGDQHFYQRWYRTGDPYHLNRHDKHRDWQKVCKWIDDNVPANERFLTPRYQQTFKWYAGRSEVFSWKDVPQDAEGVVQWHDRFYDVFHTGIEVPGRRWRISLATIDISTLRRLAEKYEFRYVVIDRTKRDVRRANPAVTLLFENSSFAVFRLNE